jgi:hypothetical protein
MRGKRENGFARNRWRKGEEISSGNAILIVTEGEKTEPDYFNGLRKRFRLRATEVVVKSSASACGTDPLRLVNHAIELREQRRKDSRKDSRKDKYIVAYDVVWVVFDAEWIRMDHTRWNDAIQISKSHNINLAVSNPCFEYWLLLHEEFTTQVFLNSAEITRYIRKKYIHDFDKTCISVDYFVNKLKTAVENVKKCEQCGKNKPFENPSTRVHLLVKEMEQATSQAYKLLTRD